MQIHRLSITTLSLCASATLLTTPALAARLSLPSGNLDGSIDASSGVDGQAIATAAALVDASGPGLLLASGSGDASLALAPAGSLRHVWLASAILRAGEASMGFEAAAVTQQQSATNSRSAGVVVAIQANPGLDRRPATPPAWASTP